jgi:LPS O-antigen subunit length determinant protein (WzzB/FepE family)
MEPSFRSRAGVARRGSPRWRSKMLFAGSVAFILAAATPASAIVINDIWNFCAIVGPPEVNFHTKHLKPF